MSKIKRARLTPEQVARIFELREAGKSYNIIAGLVGISRDSVQRYIRKGCQCLGTHDIHTTKCPKFEVK